ncbi:MAG TPA: hypothetical protein VNU47_02540 [Candidatus Paceibacterota bacterium]|nr:hypothetical protein [Candidatus Paceibacterota bacterium]
MTTEQKLPWIVSAVLLALLVIVTFLWLDARSSQGNLTAQRDIIREYCTLTDDESRARCQEELDTLSGMLEEFAEDLRDVPQAQVQVETQPVATTTAQ